MQKQYLLAAAVLATLLVSATSEDFDFYKLSLTWPTSFCNIRSSYCQKSYPDYFTIHGLWPTFLNDTSVPAYSDKNKCNKDPMSEDKIMPELTSIKDKLDEKWPTFIEGQDNIVFWKHEWKRHGKCSDYPKKPKKYFEAALNLAEKSKYDPLTVMGIKAGDKTTTGKVLDHAYKKLKNVYPQLYCSKNGNVLQLEEIRFCFDRDLKTIRSCPARFDGDCATTGDSITLPKHPSNSIIRQVV